MIYVACSLDLNGGLLGNALSDFTELSEDATLPMAEALEGDPRPPETPKPLN